MKNLGRCEKVLVISDTHMGSEMENMSYIDMTYNVASKFGIRKVIHTGDLIDGLLGQRHYAYETYEEQMEHVIKNYPYDKNISTYVLYGNHDYDFIEHGHDLNKMFDSRKDFVRLGVRKSYLVINENLFKVFHRIDSKKLSTYELGEPKDLSLLIAGHHHRFDYFYDEKRGVNTVNVPALCNILTSCNSYKTMPGFVILSFNNDNIIIDQYYFQNKACYRGYEHIANQKKISFK